MARPDPPPDRLTRATLQALLERLGADDDAAAGEYEAIRRKLVAFFDRRRVLLADELADETLDRIARRVGEGEPVQNPRSYAYGVARRVFIEWANRRDANAARLAAAGRLGPQDTRPAEARARCLDACLAALPEPNGELILAYYRGIGSVHLEEERKALAQRLSLSYAALKARAHRIRGVLEECVRRCLRESGDR
jgi:DNA-directed RNA polymerase specialized sigma24 family protein